MRETCGSETTPILADMRLSSFMEAGWCSTMGIATSCTW